MPIPFGKEFDVTTVRCRKRLLVMDDDGSILALIKAVSSPTFDCEATSEVTTFFQQLEQGSWNLVLCDCHLPGWSLSDWLAAVSEKTEAPICWMSAENLVFAEHEAYVPTRHSFLKKGGHFLKELRSLLAQTQDH